MQRITFFVLSTVIANGIHAQNVGINNPMPVAKLDVYQTETFTPAINGVSNPGAGILNGCAIRGTNYAEYGAAVQAFAPTNGTTASQEGAGYGFLSRVGNEKFGMGAYSTNAAAVRAVTETGIALSANGGTGLALSTLGNIQLRGIGEGAGKLLGSDALGNASWQTADAALMNGWGLGGNSGITAANFLGTANNASLRIGTNGIKRMEIFGNGNISIGTNTSLYPLEVFTSTNDEALVVRNANAGSDIIAIDARVSPASGYAIIGRALGSGSGYSIPLATPAGVVGYGQGDNYGVAGFSYSGTGLYGLSYTGTALHTSGAVRLTGIGQGAGKLLVSDAQGNASWQNPSTISLDNLWATGISSIEFKNAGVYRGAMGWSQADGRFFFYDGESNTNTFFINNGRMGIRRDATTNALEVGGEASKSTAGSWIGNSDARLKKNIQPISNALNTLLQLQGVNFEWNDNKTGYERPAGEQLGFTAQNVKEVFPGMVSTDAQGYLQTAYGTYDPLIVEAIRELKNENESLKKELDAIKQLLQQKN